MADRGKGVRVVGSHERPLFVAADVCACLGLGNITMTLLRVEEDDINSIEVVDKGILPAGFLIKPFEYHRLLRTIRSALESK